MDLDRRLSDLLAGSLTLSQRVPTPNRNTTPGRPIAVIVLHTMEYPEGTRGAEWCAAFFAESARRASAHFCVDADSVVPGVPLADVAWAAPGSNHNGIQIEIAGYARQTTAEWDDPVSRATLDRVARLLAGLSALLALPLVHLTPVDLLAGRRGITGHAEVSAAYRRSDHTDPGAGFPWLALLALAATYAPTTPTPISQEDPMFPRLWLVSPGLTRDGAAWRLVLPSGASAVLVGEEELACVRRVLTARQEEHIIGRQLEVYARVVARAEASQ